MPDLQLLIHAAHEAAEVATSFRGKKLIVKEKANDLGPVTNADLAVNQTLFDILTEARPEYAWLSEETEDSRVRLTSDYCFIVDPIDGTRSFMKGEKTWAHSLAVVFRGSPIAAVIFLPDLSCLYSAQRGSGAKLNSKDTKVSDLNSIEGATILAAESIRNTEFWKGGRFPGFEICQKPSIAFRLALVSQGFAEGLLTLRKSWEWDICAGALIAEEAGAVVTDRYGEVIQFNSPMATTSGIIAANPVIHKKLLSRLNS